MSALPPMFQTLKKKCVVSQTMMKINWCSNAGLPETCSSGTYEQIKRKFPDVFQMLETSENVKNINKEFEAYCREVIVIESNSVSYDLNLIKPTLI